MRKAKKNLGKHQKYEHVMKGLKNTLHDSLTITEFENAWDQCTHAYNLFNYTWCQEMYSQRERWVPIYFKNEFWASMSSTQRSEGMNFFFKGYVNVNTTLKQFLEQFGFALAKRVKEEDKETYRSNDSPLQCVTYHSFEHVFQKLYTSRKFHEFQKQVKYMTYNNATKVCDDGKVCSYDIVVRRQWHGETKRNVFCVTIDRESLVVRCDCKNFEFKGIVCSHSLRVFHKEELTYVPERYILDRWRKDLPREHLKVLVPYYSLLKKKPVEIKRYEKMRSTFEPLSTKAMSKNAFYDEVMSALSNLSLKAQSISEDGHGLMLQNLNYIGRVYGRKTTETPREAIELEENRSIINEEPVTDPVDRRGRGRPPTKRKGYYDDHDRPTKRTKKSANTCTPPNVPHGIYFNQFAQPYQFHNVVYNPPYQVRPGPSLTFQQPQVSKYM